MNNEWSISKRIDQFAIGEQFEFDGHVYTVTARPVNTWGMVDVETDEGLMTFYESQWFPVVSDA